MKKTTPLFLAYFFIIFLLPLVSINIFAVNGTNLSLNTKAADFFSKNAQIGFQENKGQITRSDGTFASEVLFKTELRGLNIWITTQGITYQFLKSEAERKENGKKIFEWHRVDMNIKDAQIKKENVITEGDITQGEINHYLGHLNNSVAGVKTFSKITLKNIYNGIDWIIYVDSKSNTPAIKQDFIVHPNANPNQIKLVYEGSGNFEVKNNQIHFQNQFGQITEGELYCYQENESNKVISNYRIKNNTNILHKTNNGVFSYEVAIETGNYDKNQQLVIDPQLVWATFYGGNDHDGTTAIETDDAGNIFIAGYTFSRNFPILHPGGNTYQGVDSTDVDVALFKFTNTGVLLWATYYGGNKPDRAYSMCIDPSGNFYVTGFAESTDFPVFNLAGAYNQPTRGGAEDAFILKFSNTGQRLWATYYGGSSNDNGNSIHSDMNGNIYVTGYTASSSFPTLNPGGAAYYDGSLSGDDAFILKFDKNGQRLWATYYGGVLDEYAYAICSDSNGNVYVTGSSESSSFPVLNLTGAYYQGSLGGGTDAFILKFDHNGQRLWSTYYGGYSDDIGYSVLCDKNDNLIVLGKTNSGGSNFPLFNAGGSSYYQSSNGGGSDAFILKFNNAGQRLWATFYGGSGNETFDSYDNIAVDGCNNIYVAFNTMSANMPLYNSVCASDYQKTNYAAKNDIFIAKFNNSGSRLWTTYWGGDGNDFRSAVAVDKQNNFFITGEWSEVVNNATYPSLDPGNSVYFDASHNTNDDIFIARFIPPAQTVTQSQIDAVGCNNNCNGSAMISIDCKDAPYNYTWSNGAQTLNTTNIADTISGLCAGTYTVTVTSGCSLPVTATYTITGGNGAPQPDLSPGSNLTLNCLTTIGTISASSSVPGVVYSWQGIGIVSGGTTSNPTVNQTGTYTVTIIDPSTGCTNSSSVNVFSNTAQPVITIGNPDTLTCKSLSGMVSVVSSTSGVTYSWAGPGIVSGASIPTAIINLPGTYTVIVTNPINGCTSTDSVLVITDINPPNVSTSTTFILTCKNLSGLVNANSTTNGVTYNWVGQGIISGTNSSSPLVNAAGTYTVTVLDTINGCTNTATIVVASDTISPSVSSQDGALPCNNNEITIYANTISSNTSFNWSGPGTISNGNTSSPNVSAVGTYTVTITDTVNGCTSTSLVSVTQSLPPIATVSANVTIIQGSSTVLNAGGGGSYIWFPNTGLSCSNCENPTASPLQTTLYCVAVTDSNGCSDTACVRVDVEDLCPPADPNLELPNVFSPNGDDNNDLFYIKGWNDVCVEDFTMAIYNRWGQLIFQSQNNDVRWDGRTQSGILSEEGTYYYIVTIKRKRSAEANVYKGALTLVR